jgi:hypothetical protein
MLSLFERINCEQLKVSLSSTEVCNTLARPPPDFPNPYYGIYNTLLLALQGGCNVYSQLRF